MTKPHRALCANLTAALNDWQCETGDDRYAALIARARALLDQQPVSTPYKLPEPVAPTDEELDELFTEIDQSGEALSWRPFARAVLARWGTPAIQPVPVSERLPGPKDWDVCGRCWMFDPCDRGWWAYRSALPSDDEIGRSPWTHWLPHWALPVPAIAAEALPND